jgi:hypothetical protein
MCAPADHNRRAWAKSRHNRRGTPFRADAPVAADTAYNMQASLTARHQTPLAASNPVTPLMHKFLLLLLAALLAAASLSAHAQFRIIPDDTRRASMTHVRDMVVAVDGKGVNLAAGAQIRGANNMLILPGQLPPDSLVKYQTDSTGLITRVWVLSAEEAARPDKPRP